MWGVLFKKVHLLNVILTQNKSSFDLYITKAEKCQLTKLELDNEMKKATFYRSL